MKFHFLLFLTITLFSCNHKKIINQESNNKEHSSSVNQRSLTFNKINGEAVLLGKKITLLNDSLDIIKDISNYNESFIEIVAVSDSIYREQNSDYCDGFRFVKIKTKNFKGIVDGRQVFKLNKSEQNRQVESIALITTSYFGIHPFENDDLTGCVETAPTILVDNNSGLKSLIYMIKNKYYNNDINYFYLDADSDIWSEITEFKKVNEMYYLKVETKWQDGGEISMIEIRRGDNGKFLAEILNKQDLDL